MEHHYTGSETAADAPRRRARIRTRGIGAAQGTSIVAGTEAGRLPQNLRDDPHRETGPGKWREGIAWVRATAPGWHSLPNASKPLADN